MAMPFSLMIPVMSSAGVTSKAGLRTFTPFVAGISRMPEGRFQLFNVAGGTAWVALFLCGGFLFGNLPVVKNNFGLVTLSIVLVSLLPLLWMMYSDRRAARVTRG